MDALPGEACCPVCREFFRDPVSIHCGHHFCRACIERCWEWPTGGFACPRCRDAAPERSLRPSRELARVLEIARRLSRREALGLGRDEEEEEDEEEGCRRHREPLEVFCREDAAALCAICRESRAHRAHTVLPLPEAARLYKEQIQARLQTLKDERDKLLELREAEMRRFREYLEEAEAERRRILSHSRELLLALEELARLRLARLRRLERDIGGAHEETATGLTQEISRLEARARELEEKCEQPARTFLQDLSSTLSSLGQEKAPPPPPPLPELGMRIQRFREENLPLEEALRRIRDLLVFELPEKMPVTLDPRTAHPQLRVAPDGSSVSWEPNRDPPEPGPEPEPEPGPEPELGPELGLGAEPGPEPGLELGPELGPEPGLELGPELGRGAEPGLEPGPEPEPGPEMGPELGPGAEPGPEAEPGPDPSVLGREGVTAGWRCWDVRVAPEGSWALGVALETPGNGAGTPGNGAGTPETGTGTPGAGAGTPGNGNETPGTGTGTPGNGNETPGTGNETPQNGAGTPGTGNETPGNGAGTPGTGNETPGNGAGTSETVTGTPGAGTGTPGNGAGTPGNGNETPGNGAGTPGAGAGTPGWELWSMGLCQGRFWALTSQERIPLFPARAPGTVRVALDYERGQVAFFDADRRSLIFAFPAAAFEGRRARPWFLVWGEGSRLALCP